MSHDVYDYSGEQSGVSEQSAVLRKAYGLLALSFIPCALGAYISAAAGFNLSAMFGSRWAGIIAFFVFFYAMIFLIEKNRYSTTGAVLMLVFTFGMGALMAPLLQYTLSMANGSKIVVLASVMTTTVFAVMSLMARSMKFDNNALGKFLAVGGVVLMVGVVANLFMQLPMLSLTISSGFVIFSSLLIMWQTRAVIDGGEDSYISAALTIFISLYNIFSSLLQIFGVLGGDD